MIAEVEVVSKADYDKWLLSSAGPAEGESLADYGAGLYKKNACFTCHSLDGSSMPGPTWKGLWGTKRQFADGSSAVVDENYIRESILNPQAKIVQGFQPVMPAFQGILQEKEIEALIEFIKTVQ
ncbi:MAG: cytochrome c [Bdellovibrionales bacterium]|nr:cytochrome c [Bdellovibrionales bacterium]